MPELLGRRLADDRLAVALRLETVERASGEQRNAHRPEIAAVNRRKELERRNLRGKCRIIFWIKRIQVHSVCFQRQP